MAARAAAATLLLSLAVGVAGGGSGTACRDDFLIREGTIIRTVDSRRRGAVFLNITEVTETARCLQACCDRAACNAAIYDQKTRSCFLFDCGPLDDYRCLFTSHAQFVSATLRLSRGQLDLAQWGSQSQHEAELASLKNAGPPETPKPGTQYRKTLERPLKEILHPPVTPPAAPPATPSRCSRFQFECHSGECIAIYNACDGIPQCLDGSDEGAELACPEASKSDRAGVTDRPEPAAAAAAAAHPPPPVPPAPVPPSAPGADGEDSGPSWDRLPYHQPLADGLRTGDIFSHRQQGVLGRLSHFPAAVGTPHLHRAGQVASYPQYEKPPVYQPAPAFYDDLYQNWAGRLPSSYNAPYDPLPRYDMLPPMRASYMDRRPPPDLTSSGQMEKLDQAAPPPGWLDQPTGGREMGGVPAAAGAAAEDRPLSVDHRPSPQRPPPPPPPPSAAPAHGNATAGPTPAPPAPSQKPAVSSTTVPPTTSPATKAAQPVVDEVELSLSELRAQAALQSAESQGAAIVLTLGVLLTSVLVVLALCRLQCGRQVARRGDRNGLAHDADYLVNGMYL